MSAELKTVLLIIIFDFVFNSRNQKYHLYRLTYKFLMVIELTEISSLISSSGLSIRQTGPFSRIR